VHFSHHGNGATMKLLRIISISIKKMPKIFCVYGVTWFVIIKIAVTINVVNVAPLSQNQCFVNVITQFDVRDINREVYSKIVKGLDVSAVELNIVMDMVLAVVFVTNLCVTIVLLILALLVAIYVD
jgi:hypothetical protein